MLIALVREEEGVLPVLPKGRREGTETLEQAAIREIEEEAGLTDLMLLAKLGAQQRQDYDKTCWKIIYYFLFLTTQVQGAPTDPHRPYAMEWHDLRALPEMFWPEQRQLMVSNAALIEREVRAKHARPVL